MANSLAEIGLRDDLGHRIRSRRLAAFELPGVSGSSEKIGSPPIAVGTVAGIWTVCFSYKIRRERRMATERVISISELRDSLGIAYHHVKNTDEPIIIQRYKQQDVAIVPLWEWRFLKRVEADIKAGKCPWEEEP